MRTLLWSRSEKLNGFTVTVPILEGYQRQEGKHYFGTAYNEKVLSYSQKLYKTNQSSFISLGLLKRPSAAECNKTTFYISLTYRGGKKIKIKIKKPLPSTCLKWVVFQPCLPFPLLESVFAHEVPTLHMLKENYPFLQTVALRCINLNFERIA